MYLLLVATAAAQTYPPWPESQQQFPAGCGNASHYPDSNEAAAFGYNNPRRAVDACAPLGARPAVGQQVYISDPLNFCILLPNPHAAPMAAFYAAGKLPSILDGEGYTQSFCVGRLSNGGWAMPKGGIISAHVLTGVINNQPYTQISGLLNCDALNINCDGNNDSGQYDTAPFANYGKEPYSGVDTALNPGRTVFNQQAGNGIFCMRVCDPTNAPINGMQTGDPCNVKLDTVGCYGTMNNPSFLLGFDQVVAGTLQPFDSLPQVPQPSKTKSSSSMPTSTTTGSTTASGRTGSASSKSSLGLFAGVLAIAVVVFAL